jgi:hypothetical protein
MRLIRPARVRGRGRTIALASAMFAIGLLAGGLALLIPSRNGSGTAAMAIAAAVGIGVGIAWMRRAFHVDVVHATASELERLLGPVFDDSYTLIVAPRLPGVSSQLAALLVGPAGVRALVVRHWHGRYRLRGRAWEYDSHGPQGWIPCRTNPSFEAAAITDGVTHWADTAGLGRLPIEPVIAFPRAKSKIVLEEPRTEVVTTDNAPWWANSIGRAQRLDAARAAHFVEAVLAEAPSRHTATRLSEAVR